MLTPLVVSLLLGLGHGPDGAEMVLGQSTPFYASLLAQPGQDLYGVQIAARWERPCQVRAFFHGGPPQAVQFCSGRVTRRHIGEGGTGILDDGARANGISACFTSQNRVGAVRLYAFSGEAVTARTGACVTEFRTVWCQRGWTVQGLQLYFDRPAGGLRHASLVGLRPLCADSA